MAIRNKPVIVEGGRSAHKMRKTLLELIVSENVRCLRFLEVGVYVGHTAYAVAKSCNPHLMVLIDRWMPYMARAKIHYSAHHMAAAHANVVSMFGDVRNVVLIQGYSDVSTGILRRHHFDIAFVDGSHRYDDVRADLREVWKTLKPGGLLLGHDYNSRHRGVMRAVNEFTRLRTLALEEHPWALYSIRKPDK
jgi:predicted O-methyltransferase YrrM